jgi:nitrogen fixation protein FixH
VAVEAVLVVLAQRGLDKTMAAVLLPEPRTGATGSSRFPGTVSHDFHEKTDQFNNYMKKRHAQLARGWHVKLGWQRAAQVDRPNRLLVHVNNDQDRSLDGATVRGRFMRPSNKALDRSFTMTGIGDGLYTVDMALPAPGHWDLVLTIARKDKIHEVRASTSVATRDD